MRRFLHLVMVICVAAIMVAGNVYLFFAPPEISPILKVEQAERLLTDSLENTASKDNRALLLVHSQTRPLFSPTRRPWQVPAIEPAPELAPLVTEPVAIEPAVIVDVQPPNVALIGIQKTPGGAKALLLKPGTAEAVWFKSGQRIDEWTVAAIGNETVELANGTKTIKLELYPASTAPAPQIQPIQP